MEAKTYMKTSNTDVRLPCEVSKLDLIGYSVVIQPRERTLNFF